ncbi:purine-nucleoside phosphorylase [Desulfurobacterium sp.]
MEKVERAAAYLKEALQKECFDVAVLLGSGIEIGEAGQEIPYEKIPGMPVPRVPGHRGVLKPVNIDGLSVVVFGGRVHYYEGREDRDLRFIPHLASLLGCRLFVATCAAGAVSRRAAASHLVVVEDHINLIGRNPLTGMISSRGSEVFVDLKDIYDRQFVDAFLLEALKMEIPVTAGVLAAMHGPNYETFAEIKMLSVLGADIVSMSTVPEIIAAKFYGMKTGAVAVVANDTMDCKVTHDDVLENVKVRGKSLGRILERTLRNLYNYI